jgi:tyrosyl-tRNA synthetase
MSIPDTLMRNYFDLVTDMPADEVAALTNPSQSNPRDTKEKLAKTIVTKYHSSEDADAAASEFRRMFGSGGTGLPDEIPEVRLPAKLINDGNVAPIDLVIHCKFEKSRSEARRLISQHGLRLNGKVVEDFNAPLAVKAGDVLQRGKRRFVRLILP